MQLQEILAGKEIKTAQDQAYLQLQSEDTTQDAAIMLGQQYAHKLVAAEMKIRLDCEFARLQSNHNQETAKVGN